MVNSQNAKRQIALIRILDPENGDCIRIFSYGNGSKFSPLVQATVFLATHAGIEHGCVMDGDAIVSLPLFTTVSIGKGLPWVAGVRMRGYASEVRKACAQIYIVAGLAVSANLIAEGYVNPEHAGQADASSVNILGVPRCLSFRFIPAGNGKVRAVDGLEGPYRTKSLEFYDKDILVD